MDWANKYKGLDEDHFKHQDKWSKQAEEWFDDNGYELSDEDQRMADIEKNPGPNTYIATTSSNTQLECEGELEEKPPP